MINTNKHSNVKQKKNIQNTFQSTRLDTSSSEKSIKKSSSKATSSIPKNKCLINSITEYSQSFMKLANDFIKESAIKANLTTSGLNDDLISEKSVYMRTGQIKKRRNKIRSINENNKLLNFFHKNEFEDENLFKVQNYDVIIERINSEFKINGIQEQKGSSSDVFIVKRKENLIVHRNEFHEIHISLSNNRTFSEGNLRNKRNSSCSRENGKKVELITNDLYLKIFEKIFERISIIPDYLDRNYISFNSMQLMTLCFLKPLFDFLFKSNQSITKAKFIYICFLIFKHLTIEEKRKFILENILNTK